MLSFLFNRRPRFAAPPVQPSAADTALVEQWIALIETDEMQWRFFDSGDGHQNSHFHIGQWNLNHHINFYPGKIAMQTRPDNPRRHEWVHSDVMATPADQRRLWDALQAQKVRFDTEQAIEDEVERERIAAQALAS